MRTDLAAAARRLVRLDPAFTEVVREVGPPDLGTGRRRRSHFAALSRSICYQQLAGSAASAIHGRFENLFDGPVTPDRVLAVGPDQMRAVGLSGAKTATISALAEHVVDGRVRLASISRRRDAEVIDELVQVRGIGPWTAEMFLIFQLGRPDVWPAGDLAVRRGWGIIHGLAEAPAPAGLVKAADHLSGIRTTAAWYCWRAVEP